MELVNPEGAQVLASYDHYNWKRYAAVTRNAYGKGTATYLGCWIGDAMLREILTDVYRLKIRHQNKTTTPVLV